MSTNTSIEWATKGWSPIIGCDRVSSGCDRCYAINTAHIRSRHPNPKIANAFAGTTERRDGRIDWTGKVNLLPGRLTDPLTWRKPERIFVNSMSDLFHDSVPDEYIAKVFAVMALAPQHTFQVLTKRHARMRSLLNSGPFQTAVAEHILARTDADEVKDAGDPFPLPNVWLGVSTENQQWADIRIPALLDTPAAVRFISAEPLLGPIDLLGDAENPGPAIVRTGVRTRPNTVDGPAEYDYDDQVGLDSVIVGGESGRGARPMHPWWAESLQQQCETADVPYLFKQWGEWTPLAPLVDGKFDFSGGIVMTDDGITYNHGELYYPDGPRRGEAYRRDFPHHRPTSMYRLGKKRAGRELYHDGRTWDQYPAVAS